MSIKEISIESLDAALWLIYSAWGVGKTFSLGTLPGKTMIVLAELKNINRVLGWAKGKYKLYPLAVIEDGETRHRTYDEFMDQMNQWLIQAQNGKKPFDNLAIDSLSELQSIYGEKVEDDTFERRLEEKDKTERMFRRPIIERFYKPRDSYIPLNSVMKRTTKMFQRFNWYGINVICTSGIADNIDEWTIKEPFLIGKEYPSLLSGYFDFVGYVTPGKNVYPPVVQFVSDGTFKAKCGDTRLAKSGGGELNWEKIFSKLQLKEE